MKQTWRQRRCPISFNLSVSQDRSLPMQLALNRKLKVIGSSSMLVAQRVRRAAQVHRRSPITTRTLYCLASSDKDNRIRCLNTPSNSISRNSSTNSQRILDLNLITAFAYVDKISNSRHQRGIHGSIFNLSPSNLKPSIDSVQL